MKKIGLEIVKFLAMPVLVGLSVGTIVGLIMVYVLS